MPPTVKKARPRPSPGPWNLHVTLAGGDRMYQLQSANGDVVTELCDHEYDKPGVAEANARLMFKLVNAHFGTKGTIDGDTDPKEEDE